MDIAPLLRVEMAMVGLTSREVARQAGLHESVLCRLLTGERPLTPERAKRLIEVIHAGVLPVRPSATVPRE